MKKGDKVEITGSLSYKVFKDEKGYKRRQATVVVTYIEKIAYNKQEELLLNSVLEDDEDFEDEDDAYEAYREEKNGF